MTLRLKLVAVFLPLAIASAALGFAVHRSRQPPDRVTCFVCPDRSVTCLQGGPGAMFTERALSGREVECVNGIIRAGPRRTEL